MQPALSRAATPVTAPAALKPLFHELGDLKRVRSAGRRGSIAARLFREAWAALVLVRGEGETLEALALRTTAAALCAARLGDLDRPALLGMGLQPADVAAVLARAFDEIAGPVEPALRERLRAHLGGLPRAGAAEVPRFVDSLEAQPRAGVTAPGRPRIVLEPPENHAEHCLMVAVYGVLLSPAYGADPATVFLAALAHHLHNAQMPDSGFTGEMLLGDHLDAVIAHCTAAALDELASPLRERVEAARAILPDAGTPEGRAFHAADVADRVLQIAQHLRAASLTMDTVLGEMELVHAGPVKAFHDRVLAEMNLP